MIYCKLCKKKVKDISHYAKKHKAWLQKKRRDAPKKPKKAKHKHIIVEGIGKKMARTGYPNYEKSDKGYPYYGKGNVVFHYCPTCGKPNK